MPVSGWDTLSATDSARNLVPVGIWLVNQPAGGMGSPLCTPPFSVFFTRRQFESCLTMPRWWFISTDEEGPSAQESPWRCTFCFLGLSIICKHCQHSILLGQIMCRQIFSIITFSTQASRNSLSGCSDTLLTGGVILLPQGLDALVQSWPPSQILCLSSMGLDQPGSLAYRDFWFGRFWWCWIGLVTHGMQIWIAS